jgi:L-ascorbate metabolism protein UlaG (beta-lactamase superfamily)
LALIECGQYSEKWADIHMLPEESAPARIDLNAHVVMPIHWAAFILSFHTWLDPVEKNTEESEQIK